MHLFGIRGVDAPKFDPKFHSHSCFPLSMSQWHSAWHGPFFLFPNPTPYKFTNNFRHEIQGKELLFILIFLNKTITLALSLTLYLYPYISAYIEWERQARKKQYKYTKIRIKKPKIPKWILPTLIILQEAGSSSTIKSVITILPFHLHHHHHHYWLPCHWELRFVI